MKTIIISILIILSQNKLFSEVQWANNVINFSSQRGKKEFSAQQILYQPSVLPKFGLTPCAWTPSQKMNPNGEFIHVEFENPINARQIIINEVFNPGAISLITAFDINGVSETLFENSKVKYHGDQGRVFRIILDKKLILKLSQLKLN